MIPHPIIAAITPNTNNAITINIDVTSIIVYPHLISAVSGSLIALLILTIILNVKPNSPNMNHLMIPKAGYLIKKFL
jgi:hypothetical protein